MFEESCQNRSIEPEIQHKLSDTSVRSDDSGQFSGSSAKQVHGASKVMLKSAPNDVFFFTSISIIYEKNTHFVTIIKKTKDKKKKTHPVTVVLSSEWEAKKLLPIHSALSGF